MRSLIIIILASYAVKCDDDASYYVVEIPEEFTKEPKPFRVYWNVPTMQCRSKKIPFADLYEKFGIIQNKGDSFRGDEIAILYDPGVFPALLKNETSGKFRFRNGGVPQEGDLERHWNVFRKVLEQSIPDPDFSGIGIIDFESWRPVFRQNFGVLSPYKDFSYQIERKQHWFWPEKAIQAKAKQRFEEAARSFMQTTLIIAKKLRPFAKWGYYAFPYCFNMSPSNSGETCASTVREENDKINWLWQESTALFPSTYFLRGVPARDMAQSIRGRVAEAARLTKTTTPILPYFWFRYRDGEFLPQKELDAILGTFYNSSASGFIVWGSSSDVNTVSKCQKLLEYTEEVLGPAIAKYTKLHGSPNFNKVRPVTQPTESGITTWRPILRDQIANKTNSIDHNTYHPWYALHNNTQEIHKVEHGTNKTNGSYEDNYLSHIKRNTLLELLFNVLLFKEMSEKHNETIEYDEDDVLPQNSSSSQNLSILTTESILSNANDAIEINSLVSKYTTVDPLNVTTANNGVIKENDSGHTNLEQDITQYVNQNYNITSYASEFTLPYADDDTSKLTDSVINSTSNPLNMQTSNQSLEPLLLIIKLNENNINKPKNSTYVKFPLNTFKKQSLAMNMTEDEYNIIVKTEASQFAANCSNQSVMDLIPETSSQTDRSSEQKHDSSVNTITSLNFNLSTELTLKLHQTSTPATIDIPSTIIPTTDTDALVEPANIKDIRSDNEKDIGSTTSETNVLVTTSYSNENVTNKDPCQQTKNEKKGYHEGDIGVNYSTTDSSPILLDNNESEISLLQTKNEKEDHPQYDTISTINIILTPLNNDEVTSEFLLLQTEREINDSHVDDISFISQTDSIPISNNEITGKDSLLQSKNGKKGHHMIFTSDLIPTTDSITFGSDEGTSTELSLKASTTLEHIDENNSLTTTDHHQITTKIEDTTDPVVKLEEKFDIDDGTYEDSEVGERLSQSFNVIQTKYVNSNHGNLAKSEKDDSKFNLRKDLSESSTNNSEDHSRNEVIPTSVLTTDSPIGNDNEENTGSETSVTNVLVTIPCSNEDEKNKDPCLRTKNQKKGYHEEDSGINYSATDSSPILLIPFHQYDTISSITPLNNDDVISEFSVLQTKRENNDSHVDDASSISPTDIIMIPISNKEITSKDSLLQSKNGKKGHHMIFTSDAIPTTDSITFGSDEGTNTEPLLKASTTLEHSDEIDSLTTIDHQRITTKIEDSTYPVVKLEEKFDIDDKTYEESEVGERLSQSINSIQTKYVHSSHGNPTKNEKEGSEVLLSESESRKDHSRNEVISTLLTTDSVGVSLRADIDCYTYLVIFLVIRLFL